MTLEKKNDITMTVIFLILQVAQLRKESRKNANLIRSLEAETKLKEQVNQEKRC